MKPTTTPVFVTCCCLALLAIAPGAPTVMDAVEAPLLASAAEIEQNEGGLLVAETPAELGNESERKKRQFFDHSHCYHDHCHDYYSDGHSHVRFHGGHGVGVGLGGYGAYGAGVGRFQGSGYGYGRR